jgi:hypothetical protein
MEIPPQSGCEIEGAQPANCFLDIEVCNLRVQHGEGIRRAVITRRPVLLRQRQGKGHAPALPAVLSRIAPTRLTACGWVAAAVRTAAALISAATAVCRRQYGIATALVYAARAGHAHAGDFACGNPDAETSLFHAYDAASGNFKLSIGIACECFDLDLFAARSGATGEQHALTRSRRLSQPLVRAGQLRHGSRLTAAVGWVGVCRLTGRHLARKLWRRNTVLAFVCNTSAEPEAAGRKPQLRAEPPPQMNAGLHRLTVKGRLRTIRDSTLQSQNYIDHDGSPSLRSAAPNLCGGALRIALPMPVSRNSMSAADTAPGKELPPDAHAEGCAARRHKPPWRAKPAVKSMAT